MFYFTSDTHFCHDNIIQHCNRPFKNIEEMNKTLVSKWNERVKPTDVVFHLGDFCWDEKRINEFVSKLNGHIILIKGNHDKSNKAILSQATIELGGHEWQLIHDPALATSPYALCGHIHEHWKFRGKEPLQLLVNVGVDVWDFRPITMNEILAGVAKWSSRSETK